ncbi:methyl-accepting chemotaxis protein McpS [bacterium BMS3Abin04]|nr:methyl-accepting chemotaxis protein McpS [bacterium BMS3Abin04]
MLKSKKNKSKSRTKKQFKFKFVRKIQLGYLALGGIATIIVINVIFQIAKMNEFNNLNYQNNIVPRYQIQELYSEFRKVQFLMLRFSIPQFSENIKNDMQQYNTLSTLIDSKLNSLEKKLNSEKIRSSFKQVNSTWNDYKELVCSSIISAAALKNFDMAADIATSSGEEYGAKLNKEFDTIVNELSDETARMDVELKENVNAAKMLIFSGMGLGTAVLLICLFYLAPALSKPIKKLKEVLNEFAHGNYDVTVDINSNDEFGELADMTRQLREAQVEKIEAAEKIASGSFESVTPTSDKDLLAFAFNNEVETIENVNKEVNKLVEANREGDLSVRGDESRFNGDWKNVIKGINSILDATVAPILEAGEVLDKMAEGDFTKKMNGNYKGDYQLIKKDINRVIDSMNDLIGKVTETAYELASSSAQISSSTEEMAAGASEQSVQAAEVASSIEEMTHTIMDSTKNANLAASTALEAGEKAKEGGKVVVETINGINRIANVVSESAGTIQKLGNSSNQIGEIIQVIDEIADQTNLLALNAAIEAARAGEQGRGFAVVADEVRKLAERTTKATQEIAQMIKKIQDDTIGAVQAIEMGTSEAEKGKELAQKAGNSLNDIIDNFERVSNIINQLAVATEEQSSTSEQISSNVEAINRVTHQSAEGTQQISLAAENLHHLTDNLQQLVNSFKLGKNVSQNHNTINYSHADNFVNS